MSLHPALLALIRVLLFVVPVLLIVPAFIWLERRLLSWMQDRHGPNRVATFKFKNGFKISLQGLLQPIADGVKLFLKEDITPVAVDRAIYFIAPAIALFPAFAIGATLPWGPSYGVYGLLTPIANVDIGILYVLAISSLGVYGVVLAGYSSNNKYSLLGGLRASAQLISYELAMGMSLAAVILATGSLRMSDIIGEQMQPLAGQFSWFQNWFIFTPWGFVSAIVFLICIIAETNRAPFDLPEAENEIIAGYHTEYSSMKFAVFFMGEYAAMFMLSAVFFTVFLGGWNPLPINWEAIGTDVAGLKSVADFFGGISYWAAPLTFVVKGFIGIAFYIWVRATLPRLRYDQLMHLGWKVLLPISVANFIVVMIWIMAKSKFSSTLGAAAYVVAMGLVAIIYLTYMKNKTSTSLESRSAELTNGTEGVLTMEGRN
ncbi:MAG: NADH-quinone oxidoreductase subunit H [Chthonomonas sp.]|nr:NADH-quinone oxidoreductase subunit H [Chthonomonas sp.]